MLSLPTWWSQIAHASIYASFIFCNLKEAYYAFKMFYGSKFEIGLLQDCSFTNTYELDFQRRSILQHNIPILITLLNYLHLIISWWNELDSEDILHVYGWNALYLLPMMTQSQVSKLYLRTSGSIASHFQCSKEKVKWFKMIDNQNNMQYSLLFVLITKTRLTVYIQYNTIQLTYSMILLQKIRIICVCFLIVM